MHIYSCHMLTFSVRQPRYFQIHHNIQYVNLELIFILKKEYNQLQI